MGSASSSQSKATRGSGAARGANGGEGGAAATVAAPAPSSSSSEDGWRARAAAAATATVEDCDCENCTVMKSSPCREQYIKANGCTKAALDIGLHPDRLCSHVAKDLKRCIDTNRFHYRLIERAEEI